MRIKFEQQPPSQAIILREDLLAEKGSVLLIHPDESIKVCTRQEFEALYEADLEPETPEQRKERFRKTAKAWRTRQGRGAFAYVGDGRDRKSVSALIVMV